MEKKKNRDRRLENVSWQVHAVTRHRQNAIHHARAYNLYVVQLAKCVQTYSARRRISGDELTERFSRRGRSFRIRGEVRAKVGKGVEHEDDLEGISEIQLRVRCCPPLMSMSRTRNVSDTRAVCEIRWSVKRLVRREFIVELSGVTCIVASQIDWPCECVAQTNRCCAALV
jgi:hypothetical protein